MNRPAVRDFTLLVLRLVVGAVFVAHGYRRWFETGMSASAAQLAEAGVPQPALSSYLAGACELVGGSLLIIGLLTTLVAAVLFLLTAAAAYFVHLGHGFFVETGGIEYPVVLAAALLVVVVFGSGRASLDGVMARG
ncbi:DoxX family protein [Corynebacterium capitovis]|uniref:DoxX family protein n=1 Tax=Corynebacterium capitovis TaxID=131081 RepID=UPI00037D8532|nr:DoxX family protein [Corynebacterium capitovis]